MQRRKFDIDAYRAGSDIVCDKCTARLDIQAKTRLIAKDEEGFDVTELYFNCQNCGKHYTILVSNREMRKLVQRRIQIRKQINLHKSIRSRKETFEKLIAESDAIREQQKELEKRLKEKYRKEIEK